MEMFMDDAALLRQRARDALRQNNQCMLNHFQQALRESQAAVLRTEADLEANGDRPLTPQEKAEEDSLFRRALLVRILEAGM
jgi:hypothetical protein